MKIIIYNLLFIYILNASFIVQNDENFSLDENETFLIDGNIIIEQNAIFSANFNTKINIVDDWYNEGIFDPYTSTVSFLSSNESYIKGNNIFYNFKATKDLIFQASSTQKFLNHISINGDSKSSYIHSDNIGIQSIFDFSEHPFIDMSYLEIQDIKNIGLINSIMPINSTNYGNTIFWFDKNIELNCTSIDENITNFNSFECIDKVNNQIKYTSKDTINNKSELIISSNILDNISKNIHKNISSITYDDDKLTQCNKNAIVKLINDGTTSTGFVNENFCDYYIDPTFTDFKSIRDSIKIYLLKTSEVQKEDHNNSNSVIVININLDKPIVIGEVTSYVK